MKRIAMTSLALCAALAYAQHHHEFPPDKPELGEITRATVKAAYLKGDFPKLGSGEVFAPVNLLLSINEWIKGRDYHQLREVYSHFGHHFVLRAPKSPDVKVELLAANFNSEGDVQYQYLGARIEPSEWAKLKKGVPYKLIPTDNGTKYRWEILPSVRATLK